MSDTTKTEMTKAETEKRTTEPAAPKKRTVAYARVLELAAARALPVEDKSAFTMIGHKKGVRLAVARTENVGRIYVYGAQPKHEAIIHRNEEYRRTNRYGGIMAEVDFTADGVEQAVEVCLDAVAAAPVPVPKPASVPKVADETGGERKPRVKAKPAGAEAPPPAASASAKQRTKKSEKN